MPLLHCISGFEGTSYKNISDKAMNPIICCCFTSEDVIFHKSLELYSTLSKIIIASFLFLMDSLNPPYPHIPRPTPLNE